MQPKETKNAFIQQLQDAAGRLTRKGLFGQVGDSFSMRVPGADEILFIRNAQQEVQSSSLSEVTGESGPHAAVYGHRADAGAVLLSTTNWSEQLSALGKTPPTLFDEQARYIGPIAPPVPAGDLDGLVGAVRGGGNVALYGTQLLRIGTTRDRVIYNAELFEKCAMAFAIACSSGQAIKTIPAWVRYIAGGRLRKDQTRAADSYARGLIPKSVNAY